MKRAPRSTSTSWRFALWGGRTLFLGSNLGLAATLDKALLALLWGNLFGVLTGAALCEAEGYPLGSYFEHLEAVKPVVEGSIGATSRELRHGAFIAALPHVARRAALLTLPSPGPRLRGGE